MATGVLALCVAMAVMAVGFGTEARRVPLAVGVPTSVLALVGLVREVRGSARTGDSMGASDPHESSMAGAVSVPGAFAWVAGLAAIFAVFGFLVTVVAFPPLLMRLYGRERAPTTVAVTAGLAVTSYLVLVIGLSIPAHEGILGPVLPWR